MSFIKSYWWVFALLIGAFLIYWFMFRTPAKAAVTTPKTKANPACADSVESWEAKVLAREAQIRANSTWLAQVTAQVNTAIPGFETLAKSVTTNAIYSLEQDGVCNPTKPATA